MHTIKKSEKKKISFSFSFIFLFFFFSQKAEEEKKAKFSKNNTKRAPSLPQFIGRWHSNQK